MVFDFALLNYTYGTNGNKIAADKSWALNLIDKKAIQNDVEKAKNSSDMVIVMVHWGVEYTSTPSNNKKKLLNI